MSAQRNGSRNTSGLPEDGAGGRPKASTRALAQLIERSTRVQGPAAEAYVARLRRAHPEAGPAEIVAKLEKRYLDALTASGAAVGSTATFPGVGTLTALSAGAGETVFFLEASAVFVLAEGMASLPMSTLARLNTRLLKHAVKRYTVKRGALMLGKMLPVGIGAAIGGAGNRMVAKKIVRNANSAFGPPPTRWPGILHLLPSVHEVG